MGKPLTLPHGGQILTTKRGIRDFCRGNVEMIACNALVFCIAAGPGHPDYVDVLYAASSRLYMLDLLVYQSKDGIVKPDARWYWKQLFQGFLETPEEAAERAERLGFLRKTKHFSSGRWSASPPCGAGCSRNTGRLPLPMSSPTGRTM